jgi:hypothetical protein
MKIKVLMIFFFFSTLSFAQTFKLVKDPRTDKPMLIGIISREQLADSNFGAWFKGNYNLYKPDTATLAKIKPLIGDYKIKIVMGTWCGDSRREVPRFFKILDYLKVPDENVILISIDRKKRGLKNEIDGLGIMRIPTFIFYRGAKEKGRIVEKPIKTLEKDMWEILK